MTRIVLLLVAAGTVVMSGGCHSTDLDATIAQLWVCHACAWHERVIEGSWAILTDRGTTSEDRCTCLFILGDSLRQLGRFAEAQTTLNRVASCSKVFWLDHDFMGRLALEPQLRLSRALAEVSDRTAFPVSESEYVTLMLKYYGRSEDPLADEIAKACASAYIAKSDAANLGD